MKTMRGLCAWLLAAAPFGSALGDVTLVKSGRSEYEIVCPKAATRVVKLAAEELQRFVTLATGVKLPIVAAARPGGGHIFLGPNPWSAAAGVKPDGLRPEGFRLKALRQDLHIVGADTDGDPRAVGMPSRVQCGTMNGVYELLERWVGVMFCWQDELGTVVPRRADIVIPDVDLTDAPDWSYRALAHSPSDATQTLFGRRLRLGHPFSVAHAHAWRRILPADDYGQAHPEYYAQVRGERQARYYLKDHGGQVCTTNPEVTGLFAQAALDYFRQRPNRDMFSVSPNDGGGFCECTRCRGLGWPLQAMFWPRTGRSWTGPQG